MRTTLVLPPLSRTPGNSESPPTPSPSSASRDPYTKPVWSTLPLVSHDFSETVGWSAVASGALLFVLSNPRRNQFLSLMSVDGTTMPARLSSHVLARCLLNEKRAWTVEKSGEISQKLNAEGAGGGNEIRGGVER